MQTNPMKDSDEWPDDILQKFATVSSEHGNDEDATVYLEAFDEAKAAIQAHYQPQAAGDEALRL